MKNRIFWISLSLIIGAFIFFTIATCHIFLYERQVLLTVKRTPPDVTYGQQFLFRMAFVIDRYNGRFLETPLETKVKNESSISLHHLVRIFSISFFERFSFRDEWKNRYETNELFVCRIINFLLLLGPQVV